MTTEKVHEVNAAHRAPADAAIVEKALAKQAAEDELNAREQKALADQKEIDDARGWRRVEWRPGVWMLQHIATQHTVLDTPDGEALMRKVHLEYLTSQAR